MSHVPAAKPSDSEMVSISLETASALWSKGDTREALRWVRRAAESAEEAGDDLRAVELARAAADLTSELQLPPSMAPPMPPPPAVPAFQQPTRPSSLPEPTAPSVFAPSESRRPPESVAPPSTAPALRPRQALRVSVAPSDQDKGLLLVRVLGESDAAPPGAHEALLVALEAGAHLLAKKR